MSNIYSYVTPVVGDADLYQPSHRDIDHSFIRLNSNENHYPLPDKVQEVLKAIDISNINFYPHETALSLCDVAANTYGVERSQVSTGVGSSEILQCLFKVFVGSGESAAMPSPGFSYNQMLASLQGSELKKIDWLDGYKLPIQGLLEVDPKMIIVVNPNNPTGTTVDHQDILELLENFSGPVIVDEAYIDFCGETCLSYIQKYENLFVLRTLSKAYSAAGIRVGFVFSQEKNIDLINRVRNLYCISSLSEVIAKVILRNIKEFEPTIANINREVLDTIETFRKKGFSPLESRANYVLTKTPEGMPSDFIYNEMINNKILIRKFSDEMLNDYIRVSVGRPEQMQYFFSVLEKACE